MQLDSWPPEYKSYLSFPARVEFAILEHTFEVLMQLDSGGARIQINGGGSNHCRFGEFPAQF